VMRYFGSDMTVYHSHGSFNVRSAFSPQLALITAALLAGLVLAASAGALVALRRLGRQGEGGRQTLARHSPQWLVAMTALLLLTAIVFNKVFSAQYLIWIVPLIALVDFGPRARLVFWGAAAAVFYLTMRIFPDCFVGEIVFASGEAGGTAFVLGGPTIFGAFLLVTRNALCLALMAALSWRLMATMPGRVTAPLANLNDRIEPHLAPRIRAVQNSAVV
jgi:hypothetical protein